MKFFDISTGLLRSLQKRLVVSSANHAYQLQTERSDYMTEFTKLDDWKVGWWKKGKQYRYCYGLMWIGLTPMIKYRTKSGHISNSRKATAINPVCDKWFPNAEYLGKELPQEFEEDSE